MYLLWETPLDQSIFDTVDRYDCGESIDVNPGMSEVLDNTTIVGFDVTNYIIVPSVKTSVFDPSGLCKITGSIRTPWGIKPKFARIEIYDDTTTSHLAVFTNRAGNYFFFGVPGRRIKTYFPDGTKYWFMVPDKATDTFENIVSQYGYSITEHHNQWTPKA